MMIETSGHGALKENYFLDDGCYLAVKIISELARRRAAAPSRAVASPSSAPSPAPAELLPAAPAAAAATSAALLRPSPAHVRCSRLVCTSGPARDALARRRRQRHETRRQQQQREATQPRARRLAIWRAETKQRRGGQRAAPEEEALVVRGGLVDGRLGQRHRGKTAVAPRAHAHPG